MEIQITKGFTQKTCGNCGVVFFVPDELEREYVRTNQAWYCPNGHARSYSESQLDKYKRLFEEEQKARINQADIARNAIASAKRLSDQLEKCQAKTKASKRKAK